MDITKREFLYELLVRFNPDGFQGAHQKSITVYMDGDKIISAQEGDALPLTAEAVAGLMDAQVPELAAQISALHESIASLNGLVGEMADLVNARDQDLAAARGALAAAQAELEAAKRATPAASSSSVPDPALEALQQEIAVLHAAAAVYDANLTAANKRIALVSALLDERDRDVADARQELTAARGALNAVQVSEPLVETA